MITFEIKKNNDHITLVQFLKINDYINTGGEFYQFIDENNIVLNSKEITEKRKKIKENDILEINEIQYRIMSEN